MKEKKTNQIKKSWILPLFLLAILSLNLVLISAAEFDITDNVVYETIKPYFVSDEMVEETGSEVIALIIGLIALLIVFAIITDMVMLVSPFHTNVNWIMGVGVGIVMILMKWNVYFAAWWLTRLSIIFGWLGALAMAGTIILSILALIFIFFGGLWIQKIIIGVKTRRRGLELTEKTTKSAQDISALRRFAKQALRRGP